MNRPTRSNSSPIVLRIQGTKCTKCNNIISTLEICPCRDDTLPISNFKQGIRKIQSHSSLKISDNCVR
jgi:hypothetical protein